MKRILFILSLILFTINLSFSQTTGRIWSGDFGLYDSAIELDPSDGGAVTITDLDSSSIIFYKSGNEWYMKMYDQDGSEIIVLDADNSYIKIGPLFTYSVSILRVGSTLSGVSSSFDRAIFGLGIGNEGISLYAGATSYATLALMDGVNEDYGAVRYYNRDEQLEFLTSGENVRVVIDSLGNTILYKSLILTPNVASNAGTSVADDGTITVTNSLMRVVGADADAVLDTSPAIADGSYDGQLVTIQGTADGNTVTIVDNVNTQLNGTASVTLGAGDVIMLQWDSAASNWLEITRSNN